jgi:hypothetical protein
MFAYNNAEIASKIQNGCFWIRISSVLVISELVVLLYSIILCLLLPTQQEVVIIGADILASRYVILIDL